MGYFHEGFSIFSYIDLCYRGFSKFGTQVTCGKVTFLGYADANHSIGSGLVIELVGKTPAESVATHFEYQNKEIETRAFSLTVAAMTNDNLWLRLTREGDQGKDVQTEGKVVHVSLTKVLK